MTAFCGRSICTLMTPDGTERIAFFNSMIKETSNILFYGDSGQLRLKIPLTGNETGEGQRCLHYARYNTGNALGNLQRVVPMRTTETELISSSNGSNSSGGSSGSEAVSTSNSSDNQGDDEDLDVINISRPLYEVISPSILDMEGSKTDMFLFWSNVLETPSTNFSGKYKYDPDIILKFDEHNLDDVDLDASSTRILCSALISWDSLKTESSLISDSCTRWTPTIENVYIVGLFNDGLIVDFGAGSGRNGMGIHNHSNNNQGGFAYAVPAPGTSLDPINWY